MSLKRTYQQGFTLIELMVSLTIGLLVSLAAVNLFITNQSTFNLQKGLGDVGDNGRFALEFMAQGMRQAGYVPTNVAANNDWPQVITAATDFPSGVADVVSKNNQAALPVYTGTGNQGGVGESDSLMIQYYTPVEARDCEGDIVPANNYILARFYLRADSAAATGSALACEGGYHTGALDSALTNFETGNTKGVILLSAVDNFQVLVGVADTTSGSLNRPQQYITVAAYAALAAPKPPVAAIKLGLLVSSVEKAGNKVAQTQAFNVLNEAITASSIPSDTRVRRVFTSTVSFRNVL